MTATNALVDALSAALPPGQRFLLFSPSVWLMLVAALLTAGMLRFTRLGRQIYAIGSNEQAARLCGVPVARIKVLTYTMAAALTGLAGVIEYSTLTVGDPTDSVGLELSVIASVVCARLWHSACCCARVCAPSCCHSVCSEVAMLCRACVQAVCLICSAAICSACDWLTVCCTWASKAVERASKLVVKSVKAWLKPLVWDSLVRACCCKALAQPSATVAAVAPNCADKPPSWVCTASLTWRCC